jgi:hypothetical protein
MRLKKQSLRQIKDAALTDRQSEAPRNVPTGNNEKPQYFRGALVKSKQEKHSNC